MGFPGTGASIVGRYESMDVHLNLLDLAEDFKVMMSYTCKGPFKDVFGTLKTYLKTPNLRSYFGCHPGWSRDMSS